MEKKTFRVHVVLTKDNSTVLKMPQALSRQHLVRNLNRMLKNQRICEWRIYDNNLNDDFYWDHAQTYGVNV